MEAKDMKEGDKVLTEHGIGMLVEKDRFMNFDTFGEFQENLIYDKWVVQFPRFPRLFPNWFNGKIEKHKFRNGIN